MANLKKYFVAYSIHSFIQFKITCDYESCYNRNGWTVLENSDQLYSILKQNSIGSIFYGCYEGGFKASMGAKLFTDERAVWLHLAGGGTYEAKDWDSEDGERHIRIGLNASTIGLFNAIRERLDSVQRNAIREFKDTCKQELKLQAILNNKSLNKKPKNEVLPTLEEQLTNDEWWATLSEEEKSEVRKMVG